MRRLLSLVALVTVWWSQGVALSCSLATPTAGGAAAVHGGLHAQSADLRVTALDPDEHATTESPPHPFSNGQGCRMLSTCASAMIDAVAGQPVLELAASARLYFASIRAPHAAADLLADPPPPRPIT